MQSQESGAVEVGAEGGQPSCLQDHNQMMLVSGFS